MFDRTKNYIGTVTVIAVTGIHKPWTLKNSKINEIYNRLKVKKHSSVYSATYSCNKADGEENILNYFMFVQTLM